MRFSFAIIATVLSVAIAAPTPNGGGSGSDGLGAIGNGIGNGAGNNGNANSGSGNGNCNIQSANHCCNSVDGSSSSASAGGLLDVLSGINALNGLKLQCTSLGSGACSQSTHCCSAPTSNSQPSSQSGGLLGVNVNVPVNVQLSCSPVSVLSG